MELCIFFFSIALRAKYLHLQIIQFLLYQYNHLVVFPLLKSLYAHEETCFFIFPHEEKCILFWKHVSSWGRTGPHKKASFLLRKHVSAWGYVSPREDTCLRMKKPISSFKIYPHEEAHFLMRKHKEMVIRDWGYFLISSLHNYEKMKIKKIHFSVFFKFFISLFQFLNLILKIFLLKVQTLLLALVIKF